MQGTMSRQWRKGPAPRVVTLTAMLCLAVVNPALAGPQGGRVVEGEGSVSQQGLNTTVNQASQRLIVDWDSFNVAANESVRFAQPDASSVALNNIFDHNPSQIFGALDANGQVFLINPNGIVFGANSRINVTGLLASTAKISSEDFMAGRYDLATADGEGGLIHNQGQITAADGGYVVLLGDAVLNEGAIVADLGTIEMAAGRSATLDFAGDGLLLFEVGDEVTENLTGVGDAVKNTGDLIADGGTILMTAQAAHDVFTRAVNNEGMVRASRIEESGGVIRLVSGAGAGDTLNSGTLDVSSDTGTGGTIQVLGDGVGVFGDAVLDASGDAGGGQINVGGGWQGNDPDIANAQYTYVGDDVTIDASAGNQGNGGEVVIWADVGTEFYGSIASRGGQTGGDGGAVEVSGASTLVFQGDVDTTAPNGAIGSLLLDPTDIEIRPGTLDGDDPGAGDNEFNGSSSVAGTVASGDALPTFLYESELETTLETTTISIAATNDITILDLSPGGSPAECTGAGICDGALDFDTTGNVTFDAGNDFIMNDLTNTISTQDANLTIIAGNNITVGAIDTTAGGGTDGNLTLTAGGTVTADASLTANDISITGDLDSSALLFTAGNDFTMVADDTITTGGDNLVVIAGNDINVGAIDTTDGGGDGNISLDAAGTIDIDGALDGAALLFNVGSGSSNGVLDLSGATLGTATSITANGDAGADRFSFGNTQFGAIVIDGLGGTDTIDLSASSTATTFDAAGAESANHFDDASETSIEAYVGTSAADTINLDADTTLSFNGGGGNDDINVTVAPTSALTVRGGAGDDDFNINVASANLTVDGDEGSDEINFASLGAGVDLTAASFVAEAVDVGGYTGTEAGTAVAGFVDIDEFVGGASADTFRFNATGGNAVVVGGNGADVLNFSGALADPGLDLTINAEDVTNGFGGSDAGATLGTFTGINSIVASGFDDEFTVSVNPLSAFTLNGGAGNDTFNVTVAAGNLSVDGDVGGSDTLNFSGATVAVVLETDAGGANGLNGAAADNTGIGDFDNINVFVGTDEDDTFTIAHNDTGGASFSGGGGDDTFNIDDVVTNVSVDGDTGTDMLSFAGLSGPTSVDLTLDTFAADNLNDEGGYAGTEDSGTAVIAGFTDIDEFVGSGQADVFTVSVTGTADLDGGANTQTDTFNLDADLTGTVSGGAGNDVFNVSASGAAVIEGDAGNDLLDFSGFNGGSDPGLSLTLNAQDADGLDGTESGGVITSFDGIGDITATEFDDTFTITFDPTLAFTLRGREGDDVFNVNAVATLLTVDGDEGADELNFAALPVATELTLASFVAEAAGVGGYTGTEDSGTAVIAGFVDIEEFTGSASGNNFGVEAAGNAVITGGAGTDTLDFSGFGADPSLSLDLDTANATGFSGDENGSAITSFAAIDSFVATNFDDVFTINANPVNPTTLNGLGGADEFNVNVIASNVTVEGDSGNDTLSFDGLGGGTAVDLATFLTDNGTDEGGYGGSEAGSAVAAFTDIDTFTGTDQADDFTVSVDGAADIAGGDGGDTFVLAADLTGTVTGGDDANTDTFNVTAEQTLVDLQGGAGDDAFNFTATVNAGSVLGGDDDDTFNLNAGSDVAATLDGGANDDTFNVNADQTAGVDLVGNTGDDEFVLDAATPGTVAGGDDSDTFTLSAANIAATITGGDNGDIFNVDAAQNAINLAGNGGNDVFEIDAQISAGAVGGDGGEDTFNFATNSDVQITLFGGSSDDTFNVNFANANATVDGGTGSDTLSFDGLGGSGVNLTLDTASDGFDGDDTSNTIAAFADIDDFVGSAQVDSFDVNVAGTADIDGGDQNDTFTLGADLDGTVLGNAGNDIFNINATQTLVDLQGGGGTDSFDFDAAIVTIGGGTVAGGDDGDFFTIDATGLTVTLQGEDGLDTFDVNASNTNINLDGGADASDDIADFADLGTALDIDFDAGTDGNGNFNSLADVEVVTGTDLADFFDVGSADVSVTGGDGADEYTFDADAQRGHNGGLGNDTFTFNAVQGGSEAFTGGLGDDTFEINATFGGTGQLLGGTGLDAFDFAAQVAAGVTLSGGGDNDTFNFLAGSDVLGTVNAGSGDDFFDVDFANQSADLDGGAGTGDAIDFSDLAVDPNLDITLATSDGNGFSGNEDGTAIASYAGINAFTATDFNDSFTISTTGAITLNGGLGDDTFTVTVANDSLTLDGDEGTDTLSFEGLGTGVDVTLGDFVAEAAGVGGYNDNGTSAVEANTANVVVQTFTDIDNFTGSGNADTFDVDVTGTANIDGGEGDDTFNLIADLTGTVQGNDGADTFAVSGTQSGADLQGGDNGDTFNLTASVAGSIAGNGGGDTFNLNAGSDVVATVTGDAGGDTFNVNADQTTGVTLQGGDDNDTFNLAAATPNTVSGGDGDDSFNLTADIAATLSGDGDGDTFNVDADQTAADQLGGAGNDTFNLAAAVSGGTLSGGVNDDTFNFNAGSNVTVTAAGGTGDDTFNVNAANAGANIDGDAGDDTLSFDGLGTAVSVTLDTASDGFDGDELLGAIAAFFDIDSFVGTDEADTFAVNASGAGDIQGGAAADTINLAFDLTGTVQGDDGDDVFNVTGGQTLADLQGGAGADEFNFGAAIAGGTLSGGSEDDTFNFNAGSDVSTTVEGDEGADTFVLNVANANLDVDGGDDGDTFNASGLADPITLDLSLADGTDANNNFASYANIENLIGTNNGDTINVNLAGVSFTAGSGDDTFNILVDDTVSRDGGDGNDTFNIDVAQTGAEAFIGSGDGDTFNVNASISDTGILIGGAGEDVFNFASQTATTVTLSGGDADDTFNFDAGSDVLGSVSGGSGDDTFNLNVANASATLDGGANATVAGDALDFSGLLVDPNLALTLATADGEGFDGTDGGAAITAFSGIDTITATNFDDSFTFNAAAPNPITINGLQGDDTFTVTVANSNLTLDGDEGTDTLSFDGLSSGVDLDLAIFAADGYQGTEAGTAVAAFVDMDNFVGSGNDDEFNVNAAGTADIAGGDGDDTFNLAADLTGAVDGNADDDTFSVTAAQTVADFAGGGGNDTFNFAAATGGNVAGNDGNDIFNLNAGSDVTASTTGDAGDDVFNVNAAQATGVSLAGGDDADTFNLAAGASNTVAGGDGEDTFNLTADIAATVSGDGDADTFNVSAAQTAADQLGGAGDDTFNLTSAVSGGTIAGGADADTFNFNAGSDVGITVAGNAGDDDFNVNVVNANAGIDGDGGDDTLNFDTLATAVSLTLDAASDGFDGDALLNSIAAFFDIDTFIGTSSDDAFAVNAAGAADISAGEGADTITLAGDLSGTVLGEDGADIFNVTAAQTLADLQGQGGDDSFTFSAAVADGTLAGGADADTFTFLAGSDVATTAAGNAGDDAFQVNAANASLVTDGDAGDDTLTFAGFAGPVNVDLAAAADGFDGTVTGVIGSFDDIDNVVGSAADDTFTVSAAGSADLVGGAGADTFNLAADLSGSVAGDGGADIVNITAAQTSADVATGGGDDVFNLSATVGGTLAGDAANDTFNFNAGSDVASAAGGAGDDTFAVNAGNAGLAIEGGAGTNQLTLAGLGTAATLNLSATAAEGFGGDVATGIVGSFNDISEFEATALNDTVNITAAGAANVAAGDGADTFNIAGDLTGSAAGDDGADVFNVTGAQTLADLRGDAGDDVFNVSAAMGGVAAGDADNDTFNLNAGSDVVGLDGGAGDDIFNVNVANSSAVIDGAAGDDTLSFATLGSGVDVTLAAAGTTDGFDGSEAGLTVLSFADIDNLTTTANDDTITVSAAGAADLTAGAGADTINLAGDLTGVVLAGAGNDAINVTAAQTAANVQGGDGADSFTLDAAASGTLIGEGDADTFLVNAANSDTDIDGGAGDDTLSFANLGSAVAVVVDGAAADGAAGSEAALQSFADIDNVIGSAGDDSITVDVDATVDLSGGAGNDTFNVNAALTGAVAGNGGGDSLILADGATVDGSFDGGAGSDTIDASAYSAGVTTTVAGAGSTDGATGSSLLNAVATAFDNVETLVTGIAADLFTISGDAPLDIASNDGDDLFTLDATLTGDISAGAGNDSLAVADGQGVTGSFDGGTGVDTLDASAYSTAIAVTIDGAGAVDGIAGGAGTVATQFDNVDTLITGAGADTLSVAGAGAADVITNAGADTLTFADGATLLGAVDTGTGADALDLSAYTTAITVTLGSGNGASGSLDANGVTTTVANIDSLTTGSADDSITLGGAPVVDVATTAGSDSFQIDGIVTGTLDAGDGDDSFVLGDGGAVVGAMNGGAGDDVLDGSAYTTALAFVVDGTGSASGTLLASGETATFTGLEVLAGGSAADTFTLNAAGAEADIVGNGGDDLVTLNADFTGAITGNAGDDTLLMADGAALTGSYTGGDGNDTINWAASTASRDVVLVGPTAAGTGFDGTVQAISGGFASVDNLVGTGGDSLTGFDGTVAWTIDATSQVASGGEVLTFVGVDDITGGAGNDSFTFAGTPTGVTSFSLDGGAGNDPVEFAGDVTLSSLSLSNVSAVTQSAGVISVSGITDIASNGGVDLGGANLFGTLQIANTGGGDVNVNNAQALSVPSVTNPDGDINLNVTSGDLDVAAASSNSGAVTATAQDGALNAGQIATSSGDVQLNSATGGVTVAEVTTNSGDIGLDGFGDVTFGPLTSNADFLLSSASGNLVSSPAGSVIIGSNTSQAVLLAPTGSVGSVQSPVIFRGFSSQPLSNGEAPIVLSIGRGGVIDEGTSLVDNSRSGTSVTIELIGLAQTNLLAESDAANRQDTTDVDWAAYSRDIELFAINSEGVQLPEDQRVDEFAALERRLEIVFEALRLKESDVEEEEEKVQIDARQASVELPATGVISGGGG